MGVSALIQDTGSVMVENGLLLDRETASTHSIIVRAISSDGSQQTEII